MEEIKVKFVNFWDSFDYENNKFIKILRDKYSVKYIAPNDETEKPDILFYSCFENMGFNVYAYDCLKVYVTGENDCPDFNVCDYAISFSEVEFRDRHLRYPLSAFYDDYEKLMTRRIYTKEDIAGRCFCSCVMRATGAFDPMRMQIIDTVAEIGEIAYGGGLRNKTGFLCADKKKYLEGYKFNLALENSSVDGYITEKITDAFLAGTVPVYWGADNVYDYYNPAAFVCYNAFPNKEDFIKEMKRLNEDEDAYLEMLNAPAVLPGLYRDYERQLRAFLYNIVDVWKYTGGKRRVTAWGRNMFMNDFKTKIFDAVHNPRQQM